TASPPPCTTITAASPVCIATSGDTLGADVGSAHAAANSTTLPTATRLIATPPASKAAELGMGGDAPLRPQAASHVTGTNRRRATIGVASYPGKSAGSHLQPTGRTCPTHSESEVHRSRGRTHEKREDESDGLSSSRLLRFLRHR